MSNVHSSGSARHTSGLASQPRLNVDWRSSSMKDTTDRSRVLRLAREGARDQRAAKRAATKEEKMLKAEELKTQVSTMHVLRELHIDTGNKG
jgi:hypothetical protein